MEIKEKSILAEKRNMERIKERQALKEGMKKKPCFFKEGRSEIKRKE